MTRPRILLPADGWPATLEIMDEFAAAEVEGGCFWYGSRTPAGGAVRLIGVPAQVNRRRNFSIPGGALAALNAGVPDEFEVLVQLHGHPGRDTAMSVWDEELVVSRRIVSIVLPNWGARPVSLDQLGIHVFENGFWTPLSVADTADVLVGHDGEASGPVDVLDLR